MSWDRLRGITPLFAITDMNLFRRRVESRSDDIIPAAHSTIFDSMADGVFIVNRDNLLVSLNPAARRILTSIESSRSKVIQTIGHPILEVLSMWPTIAPFLNSTGKEHRTSLECRCRDGMRSFDVHVIPIYSREDSFAGRMILARETTERESAARALAQRKQQLRHMVERLQRIDRLRATHSEKLSRELRSSLTRIDLHINSLRQEMDDGWCDSVNRIEQEISYLYKRVESILEASDERPLTATPDSPSNTTSSPPCEVHHRTSTQLA